jgi:2-methylcitrate dehydratase PrpD
LSAWEPKLSSADQALAGVLRWLWTAEPSQDVIAKARLVLLDTIGCALAASSHSRLAELGKVLDESDRGSVAASAARFAMAACWDEACEGLARAHGRPAVPVIAALQALAQARKATLGEVVDALIAGYEVGGRLGEALRIAPGMHVDATWPALGVATACVRLLKGTAEQALNAVRIAGCQIPRSLYLPVKAGAEARNTYLAHAAQLGLLAAQAALANLSAPQGVLEELGAKPLAAPGEWLILEGYLKPFAAVRHVHYGAAAALLLRPKVDLQRVKAMSLRTYAEAITYCGNRAPRSAIQAQFSLAYGAAHALLFGSLDPDAYREERLVDPVLVRLEKSIVIEEDAALTAAGKRGARLAVQLENETFEAATDRVPGDPSQPMSREEVLAKFARYARRGGAAFLDANAGEAFSIPA